MHCTHMRGLTQICFYLIAERGTSWPLCRCAAAVYIARHVCAARLATLDAKAVSLEPTCVRISSEKLAKFTFLIECNKAPRISIPRLFAFVVSRRFALISGRRSAARIMQPIEKLKSIFVSADSFRGKSKLPKLFSTSFARLICAHILSGRSEK